MFSFRKTSLRLLLCSCLLMGTPSAFATILYTVNAFDDTVAIGGSGSGNDGELRYVLNKILNDQAQGIFDTRQIEFSTGFLLLNAPLPTLNLFHDDTILLNDSGAQSFLLFLPNTATRCLSIAHGTVSITNASFQNFNTVGGTGGNGTWGGGGGMGAGGALFVDQATVILKNNSFVNCHVQGGQGGNGIGASSATGAGGGGGLGGKGGDGGDSGTFTGGGGGGGFVGNGGNANNGASGGGGGYGNGGNAGTNGAGPGGGGAIIGANGGSGDATAGTAVGSFVFGGGGAGATATLTTGGTGGGTTPGVGGTSIGGGGGGGLTGFNGLNGPTTGIGGTGGIGGGGGGAGAGCTDILGGGLGGTGAGGGGASPTSGGGSSLYGGGNGGHCSVRPVLGGGQGGFSTTSSVGSGLGGGGGGSNIGNTTHGDFGGGGGGAGNAPSLGGAGAGAGGQNAAGAAGGGGLGCGGAIFVNNGGTVIINLAFEGSNSVTPGLGGTGTTPGSNGFACGSLIHIMSGASVTFAPGPAEFNFINSSISDDSPNSIPGGGGISPGTGVGAKVILSGSSTGVIYFLNTNTYAGGTDMVGGTLAISSGSNLGTGQVHCLGNSTLAGTAGATINLNLSPNNILIDSPNTLTIDSGTATTFQISNAIAGAGNLTKTGIGLLNLTADNSGFSGNTVVNNGILSINNNYGTLGTTFTVNTNGTLKGTGTIHSNVASSGIVAPGNSIGTLTVQNYTLDIEGTLSIELSPTASSLLNVVNTATINTPATLSVTEETGNYFAGTIFTVLTAGTSLTGASNFSITSVDPRFQWTLDLSVANTIRLLLLNNVLIGINPALVAQLSGNNLILANYLNSLQNFEPIQDILGQLASLSLPELEFALSTIDPARNAFSTFATQNLTFTLNNAIVSRFAKHRLFHKAKKDNLLALLVERRPLLVSNSASWFFQSQKENQEGQETEPHEKVLLPSIKKENSYDIWAIGLGELTHNKAQKQTPAFGVHTGGLLLGMDGFNYEHFFMGGALGYAKLNIHQENGFGSSHLNDYFASLYSSISTDHFYLDTIVWGGYVQGHNKRNLLIPSIPSFVATAKSNYKAFQLTPHLGLGIEWKSARNVFSPFAQLDWAINFERRVHEHGADPLNMNQKSRNSSMLQTEAGLQIYQIFQRASGGAFYLREKGSFINKTPFRTGRITAAIVGAPTGFSVTTLTKKLNLGATAFEMIYKSKKDLFVSLDYEGQFGSGYRSQDVMGKIGKEF